MKLFSRYSRLNIIVTVFIFVLASISFYFLVSFIITDQVDENLNIERREIETYVAEHNALPEIIPVKDQQIAYTVTSTPFSKREYKTSVLYDSLENTSDPFRSLFFCVEVNHQWWEIRVSKSMEQSDKLIRSLLIISLGSILLILITSFVINRIVLRKLWAPFYQSIQRLSGFSIGKQSALTLPSTGIEEFDLLNKTLNDTTAKASQDYILLKEFTENASHEVQTPLAIIRSKLDLLIQDEQLSEQQSEAVQSAYGAIQRLSRLNNSLLLLAKIENRQFAVAEPVRWDEKITEKLNQLRELYQSKSLSMHVELTPINEPMNPMLADVLLNNLLSNAIRYSPVGGSISILLNEMHLVIKNTADNGKLDEKRIFQRFQKSNGEGDQNGLGLSIVKQICDVSGFELSYFFEDRMHVFEIRWRR